MVWNVSDDPERREVTQLPHEIRVIEHVWIPLSDGTRLAARVWLPADAEQKPVPAVLEYLPYRKNDFTAIRDSLRHPYFAGHGYASVRVDMRGCGDSDGILLDEYLKQEQDDALEVLAWLEAQPWCTGDVGMIGISWGGFNGLQVAARQPRQLKTVITLCSTDDRYADDVHYRGGAVMGADMLTWASTMLVFIARPPDPKVVGDAWRGQWLERLRLTPPFAEAWLEHQTRDAYWQHGSISEDYSKVNIPVFAVGGWADGYTNAVFRMLEHLPGFSKGLVGPWAHEYPEVASPGPRIGFLQECVRWFDQWLKGIDTGIVNEPRLTVWQVDSFEPDPAYPAVRAGRWVQEANWPSERIGDWALNLTLDGLRAEAGAGEVVAIGTVASHGERAGTWCPFGEDGDLPGDQRHEDAVSLTFDTEPLDSRVELLGHPVAQLRLSADQPVAQVALRLCDVAPSGASTLISYGVLNLTHRDSHEHPQPLVPGREYDISVKLDAAGYTVPAGHRLRLAVAPGYWPRIVPAPVPVTLSVRLGTDSLVKLPVRNAPEEHLTPFGPPETTPVLEVQKLREAARTFTATTDLVTAERVIENWSDTGQSLLVEAQIHFDTISRDQYRISELHPSMTSMKCERSITMGRGDWQVRVETDSLMTADSTSFALVNQVRAFEGEELVFEQRWEKVVGRDNG